MFERSKTIKCYLAKSISWSRNKVTILIKREKPVIPNILLFIFV